MRDSVIAKLDIARSALAEAKTIQETKKILDIAVAAEIYAKRQELGEEAIKYATFIKVEALAQLGRMLKETERATGVKGQLIGRGIIGGTKKEPPIPTLADLGLDKKTSKLAQDIAELPEEELEKVKEGVLTLAKAQKKAKAEERQREREELADAGKDIPSSDRWHVEVGDVNTFQTDKCFDFIITDPPYSKEYLPLYEVLAKRAKEWLKPEGLLIVMCGQSYLDEIYALLSKHLSYYWTACYLLPHQPTPLRQRQVNTSWKPLLIFSPNGKYKGKIFGDVFKSDNPEKDNHDWGQSISGMLSIISQVCLPGQSIFDPFIGGGATGVAALKHSCLFTGIDIDETSVNITRQRLANDPKTL